MKISFETEEVFFKLMSNSVYGKTINSESDISRVINNSAYSKTIKEKTNTKKYQSYKNQSLE